VSKSIIPYARHEITEADIQAVIETLRSDFLTQGPKIKEFEDAFANYVGSKYALAVSNGTAALHLCTLALNVRPGSKVITSPITFAASANCVLYCGGDIAFSDIDPKTTCIDLNKVEDLLKRNPNSFSGIIPVDYSGFPLQMDDVHALARKHNLWVVEDACHAPGATFIDSKGIVQKTGNGAYADLAIFSFHPAKHIAAGEGGMITTNDEKLFQRLLLLRTHGITKEPSQMNKYDGGWFMEMQELGYNYRIPDMLCALANSQLTQAPSRLLRRQEIAKIYDAELANLPIILPATPTKGSHAYHLYVIRTKERKALYEFLRENQIYAQVHYIPVHQHPYYIKKYGIQKFEHADTFYEECLSIPMYHSLLPNEQEKVIKTLQRFYQR
jgi:UDP-4-amino-4,6-dideoxy-N-acetyl-beta-L-altrosamine transaminase